MSRLKMVNVNGIPKDSYDDAVQIKIKKIGSDTWKAHDGTYYQEVERNYHIERQPHTEIINIHPNTNFWIETCCAGSCVERIFERMEYKKLPIVKTSDKQDNCASFHATNPSVPLTRTVSHQQPPPYHQVTTSNPSIRPQPTASPYHSTQETNPPISSSNIDTSELSSNQITEKCNRKKNDMLTPQKETSIEQVNLLEQRTEHRNVSYSGNKDVSESRQEQEMLKESHEPSSVSEDDLKATEVCPTAESLPKRLTLSEDESSISDIAPCQLDQSNIDEPDGFGLQMCDDSASLNIALKVEEKSRSCCPVDMTSTTVPQWCTDNIVFLTDNYNADSDEAYCESGGLSMDTEQEHRMAKCDVLQPAVMSCPLLDDLSEQQQGEMATLTDVIHPIGTLIDVNDVPIAAMRDDQCTTETMLHSDSAIKSLMLELEGVDFSCGPCLDPPDGRETDWSCVAESTRCESSTGTECGVQGNCSGSPRISYNKLRSSTDNSGTGKREGSLLNGGHPEGACAGSLLDSCSDLDLDDMLMTDESVEYNSDDGTFDKLMDNIDRVFSKRGLSEWQALEDPGDHKKVFIFSKDLGGIKDELYEAAAEYEGYRLVLRERSEIFTPLTGFKENARLPFTFTTWKTDEQGGRSVIAESTCEMIVRAEARCRNGKPVESDYFAVATAHHILSPQQRHDLRCVDRQHRFSDILDAICLPSQNLSFGLVANDASREIIDTVGTPMYRQWHFMPKCGYGDNEFDSFANDILLFRLDNSQLKAQGWLEKDPKTQLSRLEVHSGPFSLGHDNYKYVHAKIKGIVPLRNKKGYGRLLSKRGIKVIVNNKLGKLVFPRTKTRMGTDYLRGHHLALTLDGGFRLKEGDSGSVVYTISKADKEQVYSLGLLTGLYQAIALWPALRQIEYHHSERIGDIRLTGCDEVKDKESDKLLPDFVDSGMYED